MGLRLPWPQFLLLLQKDLCECIPSLSLPFCSLFCAPLHLEPRHPKLVAENSYHAHSPSYDNNRYRVHLSPQVHPQPRSFVLCSETILPSLCWAPIPFWAISSSPAQLGWPAIPISLRFRGWLRCETVSMKTRKVPCPLCSISKKRRQQQQQQQTHTHKNQTDILRK